MYHLSLAWIVRGAGQVPQAACAVSLYVLLLASQLFNCTEILNSPVIAHHQVLKLLLIHHSINFLKIVFIQLFN